MALPHRWSHLVRHGLLGAGLLAAAARPAAADCDEYSETTVAVVFGVNLSPRASVTGGIEARRCVSDATELMVRLELGGDSPRLIGGARAYPLSDNEDEGAQKLGVEAGILVDFQQRFGAHLAASYGNNILYGALQGAFPISGPSRPARSTILIGAAPWNMESSTAVPGRPLVTDGHALRPAFTAPLPWLASAEERAVRDHFASSAQFEYSSVWTFLRLAAELAAVGAPSALIAAALDAADDEVRHAELCAVAAGGLELSPLAMAMAQPRFTQRTPAALACLASEAWLEGCLNEGGAAEEARIASSEAIDDARSAMLATIARDEQGHAELSWKVLAWLFEIASAQTVEALAALPAPGAVEVGADDAALARHGVPSMRASAHARAFAIATAHERLAALRA